MLTAAGAIYLAVGLILVLFTRARNLIARSATADPESPRWKAVAFRVIAYSAALGFWPLFIFNWFAKPKSDWEEFEREEEEIFEHMSEGGVDADELPNGTGEFGMVPSNPIPCKTVAGSTSYLERLRTLDDTKVLYERLGSMDSDACNSPIDQYQINHPNGILLATLYISPWQKRISKKAPKGFMLSETQPS